MAIIGSYNQEIIVHEVGIGSRFTGVASNGTLDTVGTNAPYYLGRVNFYGSGTNGGLVTAPALVGFSLDTLVFKGAGTTRAVLSLVDELYPSSAPVASESVIFDTNNTGTHLGTVDATSFVYQPVRPIFVPPGARLKLVTTGNLTGVGRATFRLGGGWNVRYMQTNN